MPERFKHVSTRMEFDPSLANSRWAEDITRKLISSDAELVGVPYGASRTKGAADHGEYAEFIASTKTHGKRPDILVFRRDVYERLRADRKLRLEDGRPIIDHMEELADRLIPCEIVRSAHVAVEVEFSAWRCDSQADYLRPYPRGPLGRTVAQMRAWRGVYVPGKASVPHMFLKVGDLNLLREWQQYSGVPLAFAQFFYDAAFLFSFEVLVKAHRDQMFRVRSYRYSEGDKRVWVVPYTFGVPFLAVLERPRPGTIGVWSKNGHFKAMPTVSGGRFRLTGRARHLLRTARSERRLTWRRLRRLTTNLAPDAVRVHSGRSRRSRHGRVRGQRQVSRPPAGERR